MNLMNLKRVLLLALALTASIPQFAPAYYIADDIREHQVPPISYYFEVFSNTEPTESIAPGVEGRNYASSRFVFIARSMEVDKYGRHIFYGVFEVNNPEFRAQISGTGIRDRSLVINSAQLGRYFSVLTVNSKVDGTTLMIYHAGEDKRGRIVVGDLVR